MIYNFTSINKNLGGFFSAAFPFACQQQVKPEALMHLYGIFRVFPKHERKSIKAKPIGSEA